MSGKHQERDDVKAASGDKSAAHGHTEAMHHEVFKYDPKTLNTRTYGADGHHGACVTGPKLNDLTIDTSIKEYDTQNRGDSWHDRKETLKHEMPVSNEHFRELAQRGAEFLKESGGFNLQMRNALDEAYKSDGGANGKSGKHVEDLLKYVNAQSCDSHFSVGRDGNHIKIMDTSDPKHTKVDLYNLDDKDMQNNHWKHTGKNKDKI